MHPKFQFLGFEPEPELRADAERRLNRLLDLSPYGSVAVALLEKTEHGFRSAVSVYTKHGPFVAEFCQDTADEALVHVMKTLTTKIENWREVCTRYIRSRPFPPFLEPVA